MSEKIKKIFIDKIFENLNNNEIDHGIVIASPSKNDPDYFYHWIRDSALVMKNIAKYYQQTSDPKAFKQIIEYIDIEIHHQSLNTLTGLGEPKFNVNKNNSCFNESWGRPQNDGPALRSLTMIYIYNIFQNHQSIRKNVKCIIENDVNYLINNINQESFDLWEEIKGFHLFTTCVQYKFLKEYNGLFKHNNDNLHDAMIKLRERLDIHNITKNSFSMYENLNREYDTSLFLCLNAIDYDLDIINVFSDKFKNYALEIVNYFKNAYQLNKGNKFVFLGRYKNDKYYDGNPWIITTTAFIQLLIYYSNHDVELLENQGKMIIDYMNYILKIDNLDISEQIHQEYGYNVSAKKLTWNYSELFTMFNMLLK